jgi:hypothetical protein
MEVTFLPRASKHEFEITTACGSKTIKEEFRYQFTYKPDRETFQRRIRNRQYLDVVQVVKIHTSVEKNVAIDVHLKVWRRDDKDMEPKFSFAWLGKNKPNRHVEYVIRWFKKHPDLGSDNRLILKPYSDDTDLSYGPAAAGDSGKRSSIFRSLTSKMSGGPNVAFASHSPSIGGVPVVLYDLKGKPPPREVCNLGDLVIKFPSPSREYSHRKQIVAFML